MYSNGHRNDRFFLDGLFLSRPSTLPPQPHDRQQQVLHLPRAAVLDEVAPAGSVVLHAEGMNACSFLSMHVYIYYAVKIQLIQREFNYP